MLTRIRNASVIGLEKVLIPFTRSNFQIARILRDEGFIDSFEKINKDSSNLLKSDYINVNLKFKKGVRQKPYISFIKRVSRPGLRVYVNTDSIPKVWGGIGISVFTK